MPSHSDVLQHLTRLAVQRLVDDWSSRAWPYRPWGMWVSLWGAIQSDEELERPQPAVPLTASWFLTESGFVRHEVCGCLRFRTVRNAGIDQLRPHSAPSVGVFDVAPYRNQPAVYASAWFGPLNAYGFRMELDAHGQPSAQRLWVS